MGEALELQAAPVMEVFASIQGEGRYVGEPQVFLRLRGCPLRCRWCDTPASWSLAGPAGSAPARVRGADGTAARERARATPFQAACWVARADGGEPPLTVSVTGGEPLLWPAFVAALKPFVAPRRVHLETAGLFPGALADVLDGVDHVSLDLKLPADLDAPVEAGLPSSERAPEGEAEHAAARRASLELVAERDACAKLVVAGGRSARDFEPLLEDLAELAPRVPLVLQPVTPVGAVPACDPELLLALARRAAGAGLCVRVLPQVHRLLRMP
jgi:organic radical activating enzyme